MIFLLLEIYLLIGLLVHQPENILIGRQGKRLTLKLAGLGRCKTTYGDEERPTIVGTIWYNAPECILTKGAYGKSMDIWSAACVQFEMMTGNPLFPGKTYPDQIEKIHRVLGTPGDIILDKLKKHASSEFTNCSFSKLDGTGLSNKLPSADEDCLHLLHRSLAYDASSRITAKQALMHPYLSGIGHMDRYRIAVLHANESNEAETARSHGASILSVHKDAPTSTRDEFETWWKLEVEKAEKDQVALVIMNPRKRNRTQIETLTWLEQLEENEWDGCGDSDKVRFVTSKGVMHAIRSEDGLLLDSWGDSVNVPTD